MPQPCPTAPAAAAAPAHLQLDPGIGATFYGELPRDLRAHRAVIEASEIVTLHTAADPTDPLSARFVREVSPRARVWLGVPANYLSRMGLEQGLPAVLAECDRIADIALAMAVEAVELNGEGKSDGTVVGDWTPHIDDRVEGARLEALGVAIFTRLRERLGPNVRLVWTSHDGVKSFRIPRGLLALVDAQAEQHYPALPHKRGEPPPPLITQLGLERRVAWSDGQWETLVDRGIVDDAVTPWGERWSPYYQAHGHTPGALVWGLAMGRTSRLWACPGSWSPIAVPVLLAARRLRAEAGWGPGSIQRFQAAHGLDADGLVGRLTLAALGYR